MSSSRLRSRSWRWFGGGLGCFRHLVRRVGDPLVRRLDFCGRFRNLGSRVCPFLRFSGPNSVLLVLLVLRVLLVDLLRGRADLCCDFCNLDVLVFLGSLLVSELGRRGRDFGRDVGNLDVSRRRLCRLAFVPRRLHGRDSLAQLFRVLALGHRSVLAGLGGHCLGRSRRARSRCDGRWGTRSLGVGSRIVLAFDSSAQGKEIRIRRSPSRYTLPPAVDRRKDGRAGEMNGVRVQRPAYPFFASGVKLLSVLPSSPSPCFAIGPGMSHNSASYARRDRDGGWTMSSNSPLVYSDRRPREDAYGECALLGENSNSLSSRPASQ